MNKRIICVMKLTLFCAVFTGLSGCTVPLAMQGISGASPVAFSYIGKGRSESSWLARYDDVIEATVQAGKVLSLELKEEKTGKDRTSLRYADGRGDKLDMLVERRTDTLTWIRFDVGLFGPISMSRLMARQIKFEIAKAGTYLQDWTLKENE
ncbi:MAG: DUF3568 family protein [Desulfobacterales bacterium]|nr:MAG: DUF3568 family protein [Desulfobacterales bacterium]